MGRRRRGGEGGGAIWGRRVGSGFWPAGWVDWCEMVWGVMVRAVEEGGKSGG